MTDELETLGAWEAEKLLPLRREVAMLRNILEKADAVIYEEYCGTDCPELTMCSEALINTQATAEAYDRAHAAKVLEDAACVFDSGDWFARDKLRKLAAERRATNKKEV